VEVVGGLCCFAHTRPSASGLAAGEASGELFEDEGDGYGFQHGDFLLTRYKATSTPEPTGTEAPGRRAEWWWKWRGSRGRARGPPALSPCACCWRTTSGYTAPPLELFPVLWVCLRPCWAPALPPLLHVRSVPLRWAHNVTLVLEGGGLAG